MLRENRPSLAELPNRVREGLAGLPERWRQWREGFREDPARLWYSPPVRIAAYSVLGVAALLAAYWLAQGLVPGGTGSRLEEGPGWATLYVCCTNATCRAHYTIRQPRDFKAWPMKCDRCRQPTVYRGTRCKECRHWYAVAPGGPTDCPFCAARKAAQKPKEAPRDRSKTADDAEDPW
jgi:hypothetical protein